MLGNLRIVVCDAFFVPPAFSSVSPPYSRRVKGSLSCLLVMPLLPRRTAVVHCCSYVRQTSLRQQGSERAGRHVSEKGFIVLLLCLPQLMPTRRLGVQSILTIQG